MSESLDRRKEAKRLCQEQGLTQDAAAQRLGVSRRTVERWASEDGWSGIKKAQKVVPIAQGKKQAIAQPSSQPAPANPAPHRNPPSIKRRERGLIDELEIVEESIVSLSMVLTGVNSRGEDIPIDTRGIGGIASAMVRLLEYRRKIQPPTAAELAEQAIALGLSPQDFVAELKKQWQLRA